jgi:hypothetical protein
MKTKILLTFIIALAAFACGKDKFQTIPQLKLKSVNTDVVPLNGNLRLTIEYTDKEGDVDDSLFVVRQRLNSRGPVTLPSAIYNIPDFPDTNKGEFQVTLEYITQLTAGLSPIRVPGSNPARNEPDTLLLKFVAKDKAENKSDTLVVSNIFVTR